MHIQQGLLDRNAADLDPRYLFLLGAFTWARSEVSAHLFLQPSAAYATRAVTRLKSTHWEYAGTQHRFKEMRFLL